MNDKLLKYKNYYGTCEVDIERGILHGKVVGINDVITYEAKTIDALVKEFKVSVDDYLAFCEKLGRKPEKSMSGKLVLRMGADLHRKLTQISEIQHKSINQIAIECIEKELQEAF